MKKAVTKAVPKSAAPRAVRKAPAKLDVAKAVAPTDLKIAMKQTRTAYSAGFLTSTQQARSIIGSSRSLGEALDKISDFERIMSMELSGFIQAELATKRVKIDGREMFTEASPDGPLIVLRTVAQVPAQQPPTAATDVPATAEKAAPAAPAKRPYVRRTK